MGCGSALLLLVLLLIPYLAFGGPKLLSDEELDQVTAQGVQLRVATDPNQQSVNFAFEATPTIGQGSVEISPTSLPSSLVVNGNLSLRNLVVENLILNLNVCNMCKAGGNIIQQGFGFPVTVKIQP